MLKWRHNDSYPNCTDNTNKIEICDDNTEPTGFELQNKIIKDMFGCNNPNYCSANITKDDIHRQLIVLDSLYTTNIERMREFGLEEIAEAIWKLCDNGAGVYALGNLTTKLGITNPLHPQITNIFSGKYGYIKGIQNTSAPSLLSKYFFFAAIACNNNGNWGFPIYDTIAKEMMVKVQGFLGIPQTRISSNSSINISQYVMGMKSIVDTLSISNPSLWSNVYKFELLDYFLWHVGKAGHKSYSLLMTKNEIMACYSNGEITKLPKRITDWQDIYNKLQHYK